MAADCQPEVNELELSTLDADEMARVTSLLGKEDEKKTGKRSAMQDFTCFALYLPAFIWEMYHVADSLQVLETVVNWLAEKFLLRCPSEPTSTTLKLNEEQRQKELRQPEGAAVSNDQSQCLRRARAAQSFENRRGEVHQEAAIESSRSPGTPAATC